MLQTLFISNYALIDCIEIEFDNGLNIITGETGSGKSIVLGALALLTGDRADLKSVRVEGRKTVVEARFRIDAYKNIVRALESIDVDVDDEVCILRREISAKGTSRAFINDTPVNLNALKQISGLLLDIHTQHENRLLLDEGYQLDLIDSMADDADLLVIYRNAYADYRKALRHYTDFRDSLKRNKAEAEYNSYLLEQLDRFDLQPGEQEQLERERDMVANSAEIKAHLSSALDVLSRAERDALSLITTACHEIDALSEFVDDSNNLHDRLVSAKIEISDIVGTLAEYDSAVSTSDTDLDTIERRLGELYSLQARHNVKSDRELIEIRENLRDAVYAAENGDERLQELETIAKNAKREAVLAARKVSEARTSAASRLADEIMARALPLGMSNLRCEIRVTPEKLHENGMDHVEFLFAFNKNQALMPLAKTASGGEISRVILALKSVLVEKMQLPTIIFDEVDTGVSGDVANRMARLMLDISRHTQVVTITHIAAVAAHGSRHFKVYKEDNLDTTNTYIKLLSPDERERELATMISGNPDDSSAIETAHSLLNKTGL